MEDRQLTSIDIALSTGSKRPFLFRASSSADKSVIEQVFQKHHYNLSRFPLSQSLKDYANAVVASDASLLVVDAGANIGASAIYLTQLHPRIHVCAVEPELRNFALLKTNCAGLPITPVQAAIACEVGKLWLFDPGAGDWGFRVSRSVGQYEVEAITMNDILGRFDLQKYRPLLCKIDIEGSEKDLFRANDTWIDQFPLIVIELHDWLLPGTSNSRNFFSAISKRNFDFIYRGDNMFCFNNDLLSKFNQSQITG
jgi:FkbM family methyltransferase